MLLLVSKFEWLSTCGVDLFYFFIFFGLWRSNLISLSLGWITRVPLMMSRRYCDPNASIFIFPHEFCMIGLKSENRCLLTLAYQSPFFQKNYVAGLEREIPSPYVIFLFITFTDFFFNFEKSVILFFYDFDLYKTILCSYVSP